LCGNSCNPRKIPILPIAKAPTEAVPSGGILIERVALIVAFAVAAVCEVHLP
jgi:hypothetical protein